MDASSYRPSLQVLDRLRQVTFVAVVGPSAMGKTTLIREAMKREPSLHLVLNNTSRSPRPDEQEGIDYRFETRARMEEHIVRREFVQVAPNVFGDLYATAAEDYSTEGVGLMPVLADAMPSFRSLPFKKLGCVFVLAPDWETWQVRLRQHHFSTDKLLKRYAEGKRSLEFAVTDQDTKFVINADLPAAVDDFTALTLDRPLSERLQQDQARASDIVRNLINRLEKVIADPSL